MQITCYGLCSHQLSTQIKSSRNKRASQCSTAVTSKQKISFKKKCTANPNETSGASNTVCVPAAHGFDLTRTLHVGFSFTTDLHLYLT